MSVGLIFVQLRSIKPAKIFDRRPRPGLDAPFTGGVLQQPHRQRHAAREIEALMTRACLLHARRVRRAARMARARINHIWPTYVEGAPIKEYKV